LHLRFPAAFSMAGPDSGECLLRSAEISFAVLRSNDSMRTLHRPHPERSRRVCRWLWTGRISHSPGAKRAPSTKDESSRDWHEVLQQFSERPDCVWSAFECVFRDGRKSSSDATELANTFAVRRGVPDPGRKRLRSCNARASGEFSLTPGRLYFDEGRAIAGVNVESMAVVHRCALCCM